jgi:YHS domain-containing protein
VGALIWIARVLILLLIIRFVLRLLFGAAFARRSAAPRRVSERSGGELVRDPNCGTYVPKSRAIASGSGSDVKYFCSPECRDAFNK